MRKSKNITQRNKRTANRLDSYLVQLKEYQNTELLPVEEYTKEERMRLQKAFGYTYEEYRSSIGKMALNGVEATASMGIDTPLAVLSHEHHAAVQLL